MATSFEWLEIDRLAELLEAEAIGAPVDREEIWRLARLIARTSPVISGTMARIEQRMGHAAAG